ncbi:MAG: HlyU family transcriptional regulator [Jannaschia sp.]
MSLFSKLFGGGSAPETAPTPPETYNGFTIRPDPMKAGGEWRISALIDKDGQTHHLIRADTIRDRDECAAISLAKAKQMIDQQGDRIFG